MTYRGSEFFATAAMEKKPSFKVDAPAPEAPKTTPPATNEAAKPPPTNAAVPPPTPGAG